MVDEKDYYRHEYHALLEQIPSAVFVIDPAQNKLIDVNTAASDLLGYERAELLSSISPLDIHPHEVDAFVEFTRHVEQKGDFQTENLSCMTADGRVVPVRVNAVVTRDPHGRKLIRAIVVDVDREKAFQKALEDEVRVHYGSDEIVGTSPAWREVLSKIELVAPTDSLVLVRGETGTGRQLVVRALHEYSKRRTRPLIKLNCAGIQETAAEIELFGHEKDAFAGAKKLRRGRLEHAHHGTLFLNDIGDLPLNVQPRLLNVIQEAQFERVGGERAINVDTRLLATTHQDLEKMVADGQFREELYYRLNVFPIQIPPLRERKEDIPVLAKLAVNRARTLLGSPPSEVTEAAIDRLLNYDWPGNIRELENVMERAVILSRGETIDAQHVLIGSELGLPPIRSKKVEPNGMHEAERAHITKTLEKTSWKIEGPDGAAKLLELKPSTLRARMKRLGIERPEVTI